MRRGGRGRVMAWAGVLAVTGGILMLGRLSGDIDERLRYGSPSSGSADYAAGYLAGLSDGVTQGREEGRALQEGAPLRGPVQQQVREAFDDGYAAGANDVFSGYDGGWALSTPYVITLVGAEPPISYRINSRTAMVAGDSYALCADGRRVCEQDR